METHPYAALTLPIAAGLPRIAVADFLPAAPADRSLVAAVRFPLAASCSGFGCRQGTFCSLATAPRVAVAVFLPGSGCLAASARFPPAVPIVKPNH